MSTVTLNPTKDAFIKQDFPTTNYGSSVALLTGRSGSGSQYNGRSVLSFSGTTIAGKAIGSATLSLYCYFLSANSAGHTIYIYKMSQSTWVELEATWNIYKTGSDWTTAGGDYVTTSPAGGSGTLPDDDPAWVTFDITTIVQDAADNSIDIHIIALDSNETTNDSAAYYYSRDYATDVTKIPKLVIDYGTLGSKTLSDLVSSVTETITKETTTYPYSVANNNQAYVLNLITNAWSFIDNAPYSNVIYRPSAQTMIAARRDTGNICTLENDTDDYTITWTLRTGFYSFSQLDEMKEMPDEASQALKRLRKMYADVKSTGNITLTVFTEEDSTGHSFTITPVTTDYVVLNRVRTALSRDIRGKFVSFQFSGTCRVWFGDTSVTITPRSLK